MKRVLILDNDPDVLDVMKEALTYEGFEVTCVGEASDVTALVRDHNPDLLIIDYILNGVNGGELCHQVKSNEKTSGLPIVLVSAYPRVLKSLGDYGCDDFIPKPFDLEDLVERIKKLVNKPTDKKLHVV